MANLKVLLAVAALVTVCQPLKPPGFVERPPVHDESPPNYAFDYEVRDHDGGSQGHTEVRKGIFAVGGYYSRLPGDSGSQRVAYYADDWGFHPVLVAYGGRGYSTRLAFGDKAVATANAAATGDFSGGSPIRNIGVHVPDTVNPLPDLTQTGAAALAAENPQKPDADELLASVGAPPAPPQPPKPVLVQKPVQSVGVIPVVTVRPPTYSGAASNVVIPSAASFVRPISSYSPQVIVSTPRPTVIAAVTPTVSSHISPVVVHHGTPAISTGTLTPVITSHVAPITATHVAPAVPVAVHTPPARTTNFVIPTVPKLIAPLLPVHNAPPTATSYISSTISSHSVPAVATGHVEPAGTTYISSASPTYAQVSNVEVGGAYNGASSFHFNVPQVHAIRKPTPQPFFISTTPAPYAVVQEGVHEIKTSNEAVYHGVSTPAVSYVSSTPATPTKESIEIETSTAAHTVVTKEKDHIKESSAAAAAAAASALAAASASGSGSGFNYQESTVQSGQENYYSQSSHREGGATSFSSNSFSSGANVAAEENEANTQQEFNQEGGYNYEEINLANKEVDGNTQPEISQEGGYSYSGINEASKESEGSAQQEISQNGGYSYERPAVGLTYTPQIQTTHVGVQSGGAVDQNYQYNPPVVSGNYHQSALYYKPGFQAVYQETPQYVYSGGSSSSSSSSQTSSLSSSSINIGASGGSSSADLSSKPQGATSFQTQVDQTHYNQQYPSTSLTETTGNGYQGVGLQLSGIGLQEQSIVTTQRPQFAEQEEYGFTGFAGPIVVPENPIAVTTQQPIVETSTLAPPTPSSTLAPDYYFPTSTPSSQPAAEVPKYQSFQYNPPLVSGNYHQSALYYKPGFQVVVQETPQYVYSGGSSSSSSSSQTSSGINIGGSGGSSSADLSSKPQGATSFQTQVDQTHYNQQYPSTSLTETTGNGYQGVGLQLSGIDYQDQNIVTTQRPQFAEQEEYGFTGFAGPIVVPENPKAVTTQQPIVETSTLAPPTPSPTLAPDYYFPTSTPSSQPAVEVTTPNPVTSSQPITAFYSTLPAKPACRSCQYTNSQPTTPSTLTAVEVTTPAPVTSSQDITTFYTAEPDNSGCTSAGCRTKSSQSFTTSSQPAEEVTTTAPVTSSEPITPFYSTFPANSICRSCQYTRSQPITLLTAPATDSTSSTLDEELQQVFFPTATATLESEDKTVETTQSIDVTPKPFSAEDSESTETEPTRPPTVSVEVVENEENRATTTSSSFEEYSQSLGTRSQGFSTDKGTPVFSHGPFGSDQFLTNIGATGGHSFSSDGRGEVYPSGVGNQIYTQTSGGGGQYHSSGEEANREQQSFNSGSVQQTYQGASGENTAVEGYYNGGQEYAVTSTPAPPARGQQHSFSVRPLPPSVLYVDRPVAVPVPYAVPQYVPFAVKGSSSYKGKNSHRTSSSSTSSSSSSSSDSYESSTPSVISVTQITKIRTSGRKTADRGYVKQIVQEDSSSEEDEEEGEEVVIKGGSVKVRPGSFRQQGYFRLQPRPSGFRASAEGEASGGVESGLKYGDRIRIDRPRKLCIDFGGFKAPLVPSPPDYSQSINLR